MKNTSYNFISEYLCFINLVLPYHAPFLEFYLIYIVILKIRKYSQKFRQRILFKVINTEPLNVIQFYNS